MTLAFKASLPSTPKFVLVALCDSANDQGECYPSVPTLAEKCSLSERAVQTAIATLEGFGFVRREFRKGRSTTYWISVNERIRSTQTHYVYRINAEDGEFYVGVRTCPGAPEDDPYMGSGSELKTRRLLSKDVISVHETRDGAEAAESEALAILVGSKGCLNRRRTGAPTAPRTNSTPHDVHLTPADPAPGGAPAAPPPPHDVHLTPADPAPITVKEPSIEPSKEPSGKRVAARRPADVSERIWDDWNALRRRKRAPVTETVVDGARDEAKSAGLSLERFLAVWCVRGSQGLQASWLKPEERGQQSGAPVNRQQALEDRNRAVGQRWAAQQQEAFDDPS